MKNDNNDEYIGFLDGSMVSEVAISYLSKKQGEFTIDDYYSLPDDVRAELIDGVIYDMTAPFTEHQIIAGYIYYKLVNHITTNRGKCKPFIAPVDVQLDQDNRTMVQPDVLVLCNKDILLRRCVYGAPDFVLEVLSKSTKSKDMIIKLNKYKNAGVKEYWMIDIDNKLVHIYNFSTDYYASKSFEESHQVTILETPCTIDFKDMYQDFLSYYK